jgi:hypothetical protein
MKSVPVEKWPEQIRDWWYERYEFKLPEAARVELEHIVKEALQAAKEERDVELLEKIIEMKDKQYEDRQILSVIQGELSIGSIINKHQ